jgi:hypothetical protein
MRKITIEEISHNEVEAETLSVKVLDGREVKEMTIGMMMIRIRSRNKNLPSREKKVREMMITMETARMITNSQTTMICPRQALKINNHNNSLTTNQRTKTNQTNPLIITINRLTRVVLKIVMRMRKAEVVALRHFVTKLTRKSEKECVRRIVLS